MKQEHKITELEFLSILYSKPEIGFDLLQIKPNYLTDNTNQSIFEAMIRSHKKLNTVDFSFIANHNPSLIDRMEEIISEEYTPITEIKKRFLYCQTVILETFKKKYISKLSEELKIGKLNCDEYTEKIKQIEKYTITQNNKPVTLEEISENLDNEKKQIELTKFTSLNNILKMVEGDFLVIGASTGTGKSSLLLNLMNNLMDNYQCIYFNMEMSKPTIYKRMISINSEVPIKYIGSPETEYQASLIEAAKKRIVGNRVIVDHEAVDINDIETTIKTSKNEVGKHTIIFLDHLGLIRSENRKSLYEQMTDVVKRLRQMCLKYDCTIISACQLNRGAYNAEHLDISMLKDSGEIENSSSKIILLSRDKDYSSDVMEPKMILDICKNRDGMLGSVNCMYDKSKQIFKEI